jgi:hypothetical protein
VRGVPVCFCCFKPRVSVRSGIALFHPKQQQQQLLLLFSFSCAASFT